MESKQQHFIDGLWTMGQGESFESENPATGEPVWAGQCADSAEIERAVSAARKAFATWSALSFAERQQYIARFVEVLKANQDELSVALQQETGKPLWESKTEIATMIAKAAASEKAYHARTGESASANGAVTMALAHRAIGVFVVLGPYNFPGHLPNGHIIPALLAGNTIVFKPSELTPRFADLMVQCWQQADIPAGVINLLQGDGRTGQMLSAVDGIDGLLFTGSSRTGHVIHKQFGGRPDKMLALEMGGNNPLLVNSVSDVDGAVYTILQSAFITAGQRCTCARRLILVKSAENEALLDKLVEATAALRVGAEEDCFIGPVISNQAADNVQSFEKELLNCGAKSLLAVDRVDASRPFLRPGILDTTNAVNVTDEECFGPLLQIIWVDDLEQGIHCANDTSYGLSAGLLSDNPADWQEFLPKTRAGIINFNRPTTGASGAAPFGGVGASGNFRPGAYYAADYCAFPVASMSADSVELPEMLVPGIKL